MNSYLQLCNGHQLLPSHVHLAVLKGSMWPGSREISCHGRSSAQLPGSC